MSTNARLLRSAKVGSISPITWASRMVHCGEMVQQVRLLWKSISGDLAFDSCVLDIYTQLHEPDFQAKLIEINPWGAHLGSGSLLFHWLDDEDILKSRKPSGKTVVRLVEPKISRIPSAPLVRKEAYEIGRAHILDDELRLLEQRHPEWVLEPRQHRRFMDLPVPGRAKALTTRRATLEALASSLAGEIAVP
ncbi:hypothetical protein LTR85_000100 [Meristemomyces frigidus]|nr:hypothetical protein LTR85_000100 [Meristemomyces frigidus]